MSRKHHYQKISESSVDLISNIKDGLKNNTNVLLYTVFLKNKKNSNIKDLSCYNNSVNLDINKITKDYSFYPKQSSLYSTNVTFTGVNVQKIGNCLISFKIFFKSANRFKIFMGNFLTNYLEYNINYRQFFVTWKRSFTTINFNTDYETIPENKWINIKIYQSYVEQFQSIIIWKK